MIKTKSIICLVALLMLKSTTVVLHAQDSAACRAAIRKAFKALQDTDVLMKKGILIDYKTQMYMEQDESKCWSDSAILIMKGKKSALLSDRKRIFRDTASQVVILDDRKQIVVTAMKILDKNKLPHMDIAGIQDTLLYTSGYTSCKAAIIGSDICYSATLELSERIQALTGVERVHYLVNQTRGVMKEIELWYTSGRQVKRAMFDMRRVDYAYGKEPFTGTAIQQVLDSQGHLVKAYGSYQLVDLRKNK
jgi:hypothetical protein